MPSNVRAEPVGSLLMRTKELMDKRTVSISEIVKRTGLPFLWVMGFSYSKVTSPGVNRVQKLYEFLSGKQLDV